MSFVSAFRVCLIWSVVFFFVCTASYAFLLWKLHWSDKSYFIYLMLYKLKYIPYLVHQSLMNMYAQESIKKYFFFLIFSVYNNKTMKSETLLSKLLHYWNKMSLNFDEIDIKFLFFWLYSNQNTPVFGKQTF